MQLSLFRARPRTAFLLISLQRSQFPQFLPIFPAGRRTYSTPANGSVLESLKQYVRWYPEDTATAANIDTYTSLRRNLLRPNTILVGIIYENKQTQRSSKLIETLLADPLASNSEEWYRELEARSHTENNIFTYKSQPVSSLLPEAFARQLHVVETGSPLLNAETRPRFPQVFPATETAANFLQIIEVNKPEDVHKVVDACSFYIYVAADLAASMDALPRHLHAKILATVVDNQEFSPRSLESTLVLFLADTHVSRHVIKVNTHVLVQGIDLFYKHDTQAGSQYFESIQASNVLEVSKLLLWYLRTENLRDWMLRLIQSEIASNTLSETQISTAYQDLKLGELVKGSQQMHAELQTTFIPETTRFFRKKLPWYMLYLKNDNVEYAVKDFFSAHFMNKSIDSYNYLKGQLVARLQEQKFANYTEKAKIELNNPLQEYKANLINNRVPQEIQQVVYSSLVSGFTYYQLPLSVLSLVGYVWVGVDVQTAIALASLGWMLGFNHVSKAWHDFTTSWLNRLFEDVRLVISKECMDEGLLKELNARFEGAKHLAKIKELVLADLEAASKDESPRV